MSVNNLRQCSTCKHWKQTNANMGQCVIRAPFAVIGQSMQNGQLVQGVNTYWPQTTPQDRCGEHEMDLGL